MEPAWLRGESGLYQRTSIKSFDSAKLEDLLKFIARGLAWHHWGTYIGPEYYVGVMFTPDMLSIDFQDRVRNWNPAARAKENFGNSTVEYEGVQAVEPPQLTVWGISMYGGVMLSGEERQKGLESQTSRRWWVITGPPEIAAMIETLKRQDSA
jgi:hypothetical protein